MLEIIYLKLDELTPNENNAKKHPRKQIEQIKKSIDEFGMNDPIAVCGDNNLIIEGHGRLIACKELGYDVVPVIRLDHLTSEQQSAYTLIHNKLTMNTNFDLQKLSLELESIINIDMSEFDFDLSLPDMDIQHEHNKEDERTRDADILNLEKATFPGTGKYDIPILDPEIVGDVKEWVGFNEVLSEKHPKGKGVHFFLNDYQFERIWNNTDKYIEKLLQFEVVATPDFSPYTDMPFALQVYNLYRKNWVGLYLQNSGCVVIPTLRGNHDERFHEIWLDGQPAGGDVIISTMWAENNDECLKYYNEMLERLNPNKIFIYGRKEFDLPGNVEYINSFTAKQGWS